LAGKAGGEVASLDRFPILPQPPVILSAAKNLFFEISGAILIESQITPPSPTDFQLLWFCLLFVYCQNLAGVKRHSTFTSENRKAPDYETHSNNYFGRCRRYRLPVLRAAWCQNDGSFWVCTA
jgi:hypothetical protein